jgi:hypothetical protein
LPEICAAEPVAYLSGQIIPNSKLRTMKKWPFVVAGLYGLTFVLLMGPFAWIAFSDRENAKASEMLGAVVTWQIWAIALVMIIAQFALLRIPVGVASKRPVTQRSVWSTLLSTAFMMGLLALGAGVCIHETLTRLNDDNGIPLSIALGLVSWLFWALYFHRITSLNTPEEKVSRLRRYLWTGSILELLVAIPTHIVARQRDYCCAGMLTFVGLTCGLSVMLFAFGPAVYFLFVARWKRLNPDQ